MASLNISLPQSLKDYVEDRVNDSGYSQDQKRRVGEKLEDMLLEGINSGEPIEITPEYWENKRWQLIERNSQKSGDR